MTTARPKRVGSRDLSFKFVNWINFSKLL
jgi:hypothetical protein